MGRWEDWEGVVAEPEAVDVDVAASGEPIAELPEEGRRRKHRIGTERFRFLRHRLRWAIYHSYHRRRRVLETQRPRSHSRKWPFRVLAAVDGLVAVLIVTLLLASSSAHSVTVWAPVVALVFPLLLAVGRRIALRRLVPSVGRAPFSGFIYSLPYPPDSAAEEVD